MKKLNQDDREQVLSKVKSYFIDEREEEIGELGANLFYRFLEEEIAPFFYNQGIRDGKATMLQAFDSLSEELDCMELLPPR